MAAHLHWRIRPITAVQNGGANFAFAEIEMRGSVGGADQCVGGAAIKSSQFDATTYAAVNAFDNNAATHWASANTTPISDAWIGYSFAAPVSVVELSLTARNDATFVQAPVDFLLEYSDDLSAWATEWGRVGLVWTIGQNKILVAPAPQISIAKGTLQVVTAPVEGLRLSKGSLQVISLTPTFISITKGTLQVISQTPLDGGRGMSLM